MKLNDMIYQYQKIRVVLDVLDSLLVDTPTYSLYIDYYNYNMHLSVSKPGQLRFQPAHFTVQILN